jgi:hypothetical protein
LAIWRLDEYIIAFLVNFNSQNMKAYLVILFAFITLASCNTHKAPETDVADTKQKSVDISNTETNKVLADSLIGYWKLRLEAYDSNDDQMLDEAERKKGAPNNYSFHFNADGSCKKQETIQGRYEVKFEEDKRMLYVYPEPLVDRDGRTYVTDVYRITSMTVNEIVLLETIGNLNFWVFQRVK